MDVKIWLEHLKNTAVEFGGPGSGRHKGGGSNPNHGNDGTFAPTPVGGSNPAHGNDGTFAPTPAAGGRNPIHGNDGTLASAPIAPANSDRKIKASSVACNKAE